VKCKQAEKTKMVEQLDRRYHPESDEKNEFWRLEHGR
jgi:hypothetical protein